MTENVHSILIIFSVQLQQTETSDRKLSIFQHSRIVTDGLPTLKTGIRITLRGTAISTDYLYNFRATECGPGPAEVDRIEVKLCIIKSVNKL